MIIRPEPLTREVFARFGDVLDTEGVTPALIDKGLTRKYGRLAILGLERAVTPQICIYRSSPVELPFPIVELERHPLSGQAFMPLHYRPFPVVVAAPVKRPAATDLRAFLTNGRQGISFHPGIWHHHQLNLEEESDYLVVESLGDQGNLETCRVQGEALLQI